MGVNINLIQELPAAWPAASGGGIHHLQKGTVAMPGHHEVSDTVRELDDDNCREDAGLGKEEMVERHHDLLCLKTELLGHFLHGVNGGAIYVGLASFAQTAIACGNPKALQQTL